MNTVVALARKYFDSLADMHQRLGITSERVERARSEVQSDKDRKERERSDAMRAFKEEEDRRQKEADEAQNRVNQSKRFNGLLTDLKNLADVFLNESSNNDFAFLVRELAPYESQTQIKTLLNKRRQLCKEFSDLWNRELQTILKLQNNGQEDGVDKILSVLSFFENFGLVDEDVRSGHPEKTAGILGAMYGAMGTGVAGYKTISKGLSVKLRKLLKTLSIFPKQFAKFVLVDCIAFDVIATVALLLWLPYILAHEEDIAERDKQLKQLTGLQKNYLHNLNALAKKLDEINQVERQILRLTFPGSDDKTQELRKTLSTVERLGAALGESSVFVDPKFLKYRIEKALERHKGAGEYVPSDPEINRKIDDANRKHHHLSQFMKENRFRSIK